ncbi:hypothetical protein GCM10009678_50990 [Actinomadura kijaniata]
MLGLPERRLGVLRSALLGLPPGVVARLRAAVLRLAPRVAARRLPVLGSAVLGSAVLGLPVLRLALLRTALLGLAPGVVALLRAAQRRLLALLAGRLLVLGLPPRVLLARRLVLLAPRVLLLSVLRGAVPMLRSAVLGLRMLRLALLGLPPGVVAGGLLAPRVAARLLSVLRAAVLGLSVLGLPVLLVGLAAGLSLRPSGGMRRGNPWWLLVLVPAGTTRAAPGAGQVGAAAQAEQVARLERLVTDRTSQGRHDTSPARTPARSSVVTR